MPARFWVPLGVSQMPEQHHVHAALSGWFDRDGDEPAVVAHDSLIKPYTLSPPSVQDDGVGVEITTLTDDAESRFHAMATATRSIRLGADRVPVGRPRRIQQVSWESLRSASTAREWTVEFLTPTSFRTGKHSHAIPTAGLVLRSAQLAWNKFSPAPPISLSRSIIDAVFPIDLELTTGRINLGARTQRGCLGWVTYRCPDHAAAAVAAPLFGLLPFTGVGSNRVKGLGQVAVATPQARNRSREAVAQ